MPAGPTVAAHGDRAVRGLASLSDSIVVSVGGDGVARQWDVRAGTSAGPDLTVSAEGVSTICAFTGSAGGARIFTGTDDGTVRVWDPVTGEPMCDPRPGHTGRVQAACVSAGGLTWL